ncbi:hypothetical protein EDB89DRAFT_2080696 [Lactarius sanguifluus]|nr:hypothetical protein EDB89DRAFT_2080696 [Lactarius sanguifluus]
MCRLVEGPRQEPRAETSDSATWRLSPRPVADEMRSAHAADRSTQKQNDGAWQTSTNQTTTTFEIVVDPPRELCRVPKAKPQPQPSARRYKPRCAAGISIMRQPRSLCSRPCLCTRPRPRLRLVRATPAAAILASQPPRRQLARRPLADDPARTCTYGIATPPRTQSSARVARSSGSVCKMQDMQQHSNRQGFCYEAAVGCARSPAPTTHIGVSATANNSAPAIAIATDPGLQHTSLDLHPDIDISMDLGVGPVHAHAVVDAPPHPPSDCCALRTTQMGPCSTL